MTSDMYVSVPDDFLSYTSKAMINLKSGRCTIVLYNRPVSCKDSRMQLSLIAVTSRLDAVVACINVL